MKMKKGKIKMSLEEFKHELMQAGIAGWYYGKDETYSEEGNEKYADERIRNISRGDFCKDW